MELFTDLMALKQSPVLQVRRGW